MLGAFTDQAHNLILLAGDETRMRGRSVVEPEHLPLALRVMGGCGTGEAGGRVGPPVP